MNECNENISEGYYEYANSLKKKKRTQSAPDDIDKQITEAIRKGDMAKAIEQSRENGNGWNDVSQIMQYIQLSRELPSKNGKPLEYIV